MCLHHPARTQPAWCMCVCVCDGLYAFARTLACTHTYTMQVECGLGGAGRQRSLPQLWTLATNCFHQWPQTATSFRKLPPWATHSHPMLVSSLPPPPLLSPTTSLTVSPNPLPPHLMLPLLPLLLVLLRLLLLLLIHPTIAATAIHPGTATTADAASADAAATAAAQASGSF